MARLKVRIGQYTEAGRKEANQDFLGAVVPTGTLLVTKGACVAIADGIGSSAVSQEASELAVTSFLEDYYCTSEAWAVRTSAERVIGATNSWLYAQTRNSEYRYELDRGYVCTFSALVVKGRTAHVLHVGDARIYRVTDGHLVQLTRDHRVQEAGEPSYLSRALGISDALEIDYKAIEVAEGATFLLATDGVHEHVDAACVSRVLGKHADDLNQAAQALVRAAFEAGSDDNLSVALLRVDSLSSATTVSAHKAEESELPLPPVVEPGQELDSYEIVRTLHSSHRSHVYLARDRETAAEVVLKIPAIDLRSDPVAIDRFLMEDWIARRIHSSFVVKPAERARQRKFAYNVFEFVEGQSLAQWMRDHPRPDLEAVRGMVEQVGAGLQALHRQDMIHQDIRPENILIDRAGRIKVIDLGSVRVAGVAERVHPGDAERPPGTLQYTAPECFLGEAGSSASDIFSLGVLTYQMLCGRLPYGARAAQVRTRAQQIRLKYESVLSDDRELPAWLDATLERAVHSNPRRRYQELSEFLYDLRYPSAHFLARKKLPLAESNPVQFWKTVSAVLFLSVLVLLARSQLQRPAQPAEPCEEPAAGLQVGSGASEAR